MELNFIEIWLMSNLTYRYYRRLNNRQKAYIDSLDLEPDYKLLAYKIKKLYGLSLSQSISIAKEKHGEYIDWVEKQSMKYTRKYSSETSAAKEFLHQGFKSIKYRGDLSSLEANIIHGLKTLKLDLELSYITSNKPIAGYIYILPLGFNHSYSNMAKHKKKKYVHNIYGLYGVPGHTKLYNQ